MDADGTPPPTYPDVAPQPGPTQTPPRSSTKGTAGCLIVVFLFFPLLSFFFPGVAEVLEQWHIRSAELMVIFHLLSVQHGNK